MTLLQKIIACFILCYGIFFGILVCLKAWKQRIERAAGDSHVIVDRRPAQAAEDSSRMEVRSSVQVAKSAGDSHQAASAPPDSKTDSSASPAPPDSGSFPQLALSQFVVYFLSTMGFPDFVMNTLVLTQTGWTETRRIPPTLVAASVTPGAVIAFSYLRNGQMLDTTTMVACMIAIAAGAFTGAHVMLNLSGQLVRRIMMFAMAGSMAALVVKMIVTGGATGSDTSLSLIKLCIVLPIVFCFGFLNMFGVPMKPASTALFLLAGLSPITTLTLMLVIGFISPMSGSIQVVKSGKYHQKLAVSSVIFGSIGAIIGTFVTFSLNATFLNIILLCIMGFTVLVLARKR